MIEIIPLEIPDSISLSQNTKQNFKFFAQAMLSRIFVGEVRYGVAHRRKRYLDRLEKEVAAYRRTGNLEHLFNAANYCVLECIAPQHPKHHLDATVDSVTREPNDKHTPRSR